MTVLLSLLGYAYEFCGGRCELGKLTDDNISDNKSLLELRINCFMVGRIEIQIQIIYLRQTG